MILEEKQEFALLSRKCVVIGSGSFHSQRGSYDADGGLFHAGHLLYLQSWRSADFCGNCNVFLCVVRNHRGKLPGFCWRKMTTALKNKQSSGRRKQVSKIYWRSVTAIYLAVSFLTNRWDCDLDHLGLRRGAMWRGFCYNVFIEKISSRRAQSGGSQQMTAL